MTLFIFLILKFLTLLIITLYAYRLIFIHILFLFTENPYIFSNMDIIISKIIIILALLLILYLAIFSLVEEIEDIRDYPKEFLKAIREVFCNEMKILFIIYTYIVYLNSYIVSFYRYIKDLILRK